MSDSNQARAGPRMVHTGWRERDSMCSLSESQSRELYVNSLHVCDLAKDLLIHITETQNRYFLVSYRTCYLIFMYLIPYLSSL